MLSIHNLSLCINKNRLFSNINITLFPSCILYLKGNNGSGKTSFLRLIAGIQKPSVGQIFYKQALIDNLPKPYCTYIGHFSGFKNELTVYDSLKFWSKIYNSTESLDATIYYFNLFEILDRKYYQLSQGNKKKVSLARILACPSDLWLLDEVDTNLDSQNKELLYYLITTKANNGGIILISSNYDNNLIKTVQTLNIPDYL